MKARRILIFGLVLIALSLSFGAPKDEKIPSEVYDPCGELPPTYGSDC